MSAAPLPRPEIERRKGFAPLPNECLWDWSRLVSGDAQVLSILFINAELHPPREKGQPAPKWTRAITNEELAAFGRCTVRAIETAFKDLIERKVVTRKKTAQGFAYAIPFETWPELPDRPSKIIPIADPEQAEEESEEEANKPRGQVLQVFAKPQKVRAGGRTRPKELPAAAGKLQFEAQSEIEFDARMCDGILTIRAKSEHEANIHGTKGEGKTKRISLDTSEPVETIKPELLTSLHILLDDYCLRHYGTIPNDKLLAKIQKALGKATIHQFESVLRAKIRTGKPISMGLLINLAGDAALGASRSAPQDYDPMGRPRGKMSRE